MRIGVHVEAVGAGLPYERAFPLLRSLGAQGVELVMKEGAPLSLATTGAQLAAIARLAQDEGLAVSGLTNGYSWTLPMTSDSQATRRAGEAAMRRALEAAARLGTDSLLVVPGYAKTDFVSPAEDIPVPVALERAREGVRRAAEFGRECGVSVNVEVVWSGMLRTPRAMRDFLAGVEGAGLYLDTGNVYPEGEPVAWIEELGGRIRRVHMKDFQPGAQGLAAFCTLGEGCVDFPAVLRALRGAGYDGWLGVELHLDKSVGNTGHALSFLRALAQA